MTIDRSKYKFTKFDPNRSTPIVYGMRYPGIVLVFGVPYNDPKVKAPCYRVGDDPRVGFNTAKWVESEPDGPPNDPNEDDDVDPRQYELEDAEARGGMTDAERNPGLR